MPLSSYRANVMGSPTTAMPELDGSQIRVFRTGLLSAFVGPDQLDNFLREELDKRLDFYAGSGDPFPIAAFKLIEGAQSEEWIDELIVKAHRARPRNRSSSPWIMNFNGESKPARTARGFSLLSRSRLRTGSSCSRSLPSTSRRYSLSKSSAKGNLHVLHAQKPPTDL
jgi:effector-associated domain 1 (EAD1)-containing protein